MGYLIGIINRNTQYLVATDEGIITCSTSSRVTDEESYGKESVQTVSVRYSDYVRSGARSGPIGREAHPRQ